MTGSDPHVVEEITHTVCDVVNVSAWINFIQNITDIATIGEAAENRVMEITSMTQKIVVWNTRHNLPIDANNSKEKIEK